MMANRNALTITRRFLDVLITALSVLLMGGITAFENPAVHEWLGTSLIVLWIFHNALNCGFYKSLFCGKYNAARITMTVINAALLVCAVLLAVSGIMLSNSVFVFLNIQNGMGFARTAHLVASHWYFILIALHFALHVGVVFGNIRALKSNPHSVVAKVLHVIALIFSAYGIYAFIVRGYYKYLFNSQRFFFFDIERGFALFLLDYVSIFVLATTLFYYALKLSGIKKVPNSNCREQS